MKQVVLKALIPLYDNFLENDLINNFTFEKAEVDDINYDEELIFKNTPTPEITTKFNNESEFEEPFFNNIPEISGVAIRLPSTPLSYKINEEEEKNANSLEKINLTSLNENLLLSKNNEIGKKEKANF